MNATDHPFVQNTGQKRRRDRCGSSKPTAPRQAFPLSIGKSRLRRDSSAEFRSHAPVRQRRIPEVYFAFYRTGSKWTTPNSLLVSRTRLPFRVFAGEPTPLFSESGSGCKTQLPLP